MIFVFHWTTKKKNYRRHTHTHTQTFFFFNFFWKGNSIFFKNINKKSHSTKLPVISGFFTYFFLGVIIFLAHLRTHTHTEKRKTSPPPSVRWIDNYKFSFLFFFFWNLIILWLNFPSPPLSSFLSFGFFLIFSLYVCVIFSYWFHGRVHHCQKKKTFGWFCSSAYSWNHASPPFPISLCVSRWIVRGFYISVPDAS